MLFFDPFKILILRTATTYFLIGLALVDLLLAATQEAMYATCFIMMFLRHPVVNLCIHNVFHSFARNGSLCNRPGTYNVILHLFIVPNLTIIFYVLLYKAFKKQMSASENLREGNNVQNRDRHTTLERKFIIMNFLLIAILFLCCEPIVILWAVRWFFNGFNPNSLKALIAYLMLKNVLYLKLLLDPFVLAWRVPKYRQALKIVLRCGREAPKTTLSDRVLARMNKSRDTDHS